MHGGKSTGPRTEAGLARSRRSNWRHGHYSAAAKVERVQARAERREAVQMMRLLKRLGPEALAELMRMRAL